MLDREEQDQAAAARRELADVPASQLVEKLLAARADVARMEREAQETGRDFARIERILDAVREVLYCEIPSAWKGDIISLANAAREALAEQRRKDEIPF